MQLNTANTRLLNAFESFATVRNYKKIKSLYVTPVRAFLEWTEKRGIKKISKIETAHVMEYYHHLSNRPNLRRSGMLSDSSINNHLMAISLLAEYLLAQRTLSSPWVVPRKKDLTKIERKILTVEEIKTLYTMSTTQEDRALLSLAYGCGLRRSEIVKLNLSDIKLSQGMLIVQEGKGGKRREVPMSDTVVTHLKTFILDKRNENLLNAKVRQEAFFVNRLGKRVSGEYIYRMLQRIIMRCDDQRIKDKNITLHCLRHSIATHLAENGASIDFIREFLGHAELDTSQIYAKRRKRNNVFKV